MQNQDENSTVRRIQENIHQVQKVSIAVNKGNEKPKVSFLLEGDELPVPFKKAVTLLEELGISCAEGDKSNQDSNELDLSKIEGIREGHSDAKRLTEVIDRNPRLLRSGSGMLTIEWTITRFEGFGNSPTTAFRLPTDGLSNEQINRILKANGINQS